MRHKTFGIRSIQIALLIISFIVLTGGDLAAKNSTKKETKEPAPRQITDFTAKEKSAAKTTEENAATDPAVKEGDDPTSTNVSAEETNPFNYEAPVVEETSYGWLIVKTIFLLGLFGVGFYFFYKYLSKRSLIPNMGQGVISQLSVAPLGQNKFIHVVEIGSKVYILGVTDSNVNLISEVTGKDEIDRIRLSSSKTTPVNKQTFQDFVAEGIGSLVSFIGKTKGAVEKKRKNVHEDYAQETRMDYLKTQHDRLKKLNGYHDDTEK